MEFRVNGWPTGERIGFDAGGKVFKTAPG